MNLSVEIANLVADPSFVQSVLEPTPESEAFWREWVEEREDRLEIFLEARLIVLKTESNHFKLDADKKLTLWKDIEEKAFQFDPPQKHSTDKKVVVHRKIQLWQKIAAALIVGLGFFYLLNQKFNTGELIVLTNEMGKKSEFVLADGTKVWLNADSKLTYNTSWKKVREVTLEGEAFFDVAEDKTKPFVVKTSEIMIKVLGTAFNVKSYRDGSTIETTLVRGKVMIEMQQSEKNPIMLAEKQQAVYSLESKELSLSEVQTEQFTSWTKGKLIITNEPFSEVKTKLERWYGIRILLDDQSNLVCRYSAIVDNIPIRKVLELFQETSNITYEFISEDTLIIKGSLCTEQTDK